MIVFESSAPAPPMAKQVDGLVVLQRLLHDAAAPALADDHLQPLVEQRRRERVEPHGRRRAGGADDAPGPRGRRADVVDDLALHVDRQRLALGERRDHAAVRGVAGGVDGAVEAHVVADAQLRDVVVGERRRRRGSRRRLVVIGMVWPPVGVLRCLYQLPLSRTAAVGSGVRR